MVVTMSKQINCERFETQSVTNKGLGIAEGFCKVSLEYCVKWIQHCSTHASKRTNSKNTHGPDLPVTEDSVQRNVSKSNRQTRCNSVPDKGTTRDMLDIIDEEAALVEVDTGDCGEVLLKASDKESTEPSDSEHSFDSPMSGPSFPLDIIDEEAALVEVDTGDCGEELLKASDKESTEPSDSEHLFDSTMSGPSFPHMMLGLCFACQRLYLTAKNKKRPLKNKLLDNDPTSLTCDQWVMQKRRSTRRLHNKKLTLWDDHVIVRVKSFHKNQQKGERDQPTCSRPHTFLKRNLKQCTVGIKRGRSTARKSKRKRLTDVTEDRSLTKQPRLDDSGLHSISNLHSDASLHSNSSDPRNISSCSNPLSSDEEGSSVRCFEVISTSVNVNGTDQLKKSPPKQSAAKPYLDDSCLHSDPSLHSDTLDPSQISSCSNPVCSDEEGASVRFFEVISTSVNVNGTDQWKMSPPKQSSAKKRACFNELFAQIFHKKSSIEQL